MKSSSESNKHGETFLGRVAGGDVVPVLEPELAALQAGLDELAAAESSSAPAGLSDRVFEASRAAIVGASKSAVVARIGPDAPGRLWMIAPLRVAAGVALAATIALALIAGQGRHRAVVGTVEVRGAALESEVNEWLALSNGMMGDLAMQIDGLDEDAASLREQLFDGPLATDLFMDEGAF